MEQYNISNPLRVFEAFAGYGSQAMALQRLKEQNPTFDYRVVGISEIDAPAIKSYMAVHGETTNYGDISKVDWNEVEDFDLFTYSFPCFVAGTMITTSKGMKPIEAIVEGDEVLTHTNTYHRVLCPMVHSYKGTMYRIKGMAFDCIECTPEHPFYVRRKYRYGHEAKRAFRDPEWVLAKDLNKVKDYRNEDYIGMPVNQVEIMPVWNGTIDNRWGHDKPVNELSELFGKGEFWYVMGRYVGDGWKRSSDSGKGIVICCSERNEEQLKQAIGSLGWNYSEVQERTVKKIHICKKELNDFVNRYGYKAHGKRIDAETQNLPKDLLKAFIEGYMDSDGYIAKDGTHKLATVSRELAYNIVQCVAKVYNVPAKMYVSKRSKKTVIEGREVNQRDSISVCWKMETRKQDKAFCDNGFVWFPIASIETFETESTDVYNMEVESDNSYVANNVIVHNCTDISNAGQQKGLSEGSGTRSSLLWECRRAIETKKPKFLLMENVKALTQESFMPFFQKWIDEVENYGYVNYWQVMNAKDYGVPQNRERVFMVSIRIDDGMAQGFKFPEREQLQSCLADVLESDPDESFYLDDERVKMLMEEVDSKKLNEIGFKVCK